MTELTTEDIEQMLANNKGIAIRLSTMTGNDVSIDKIAGILSQLEAQMPIEVVTYSSNALLHAKIEARKTESIATACQKFLYRMHLDYLPYTEVIVFLADSEENMRMLEKTCARYGILDVNGIIARTL